MDENQIKALEGLKSAVSKFDKPDSLRGALGKGGFSEKSLSKLDKDLLSLDKAFTRYNMVRSSSKPNKFIIAYDSFVYYANEVIKLVKKDMEMGRKGIRTGLYQSSYSKIMLEKVIKALEDVFRHLYGNIFESETIVERVMGKSFKLCSNFDSNTETCVSGCYDEKVLKRSLCPYEKQEHSFCSCYSDTKVKSKIVHGVTRGIG